MSFKRYASDNDSAGGVWRTVGGRRIFIKDGQDLASAMKASGKFNYDDEYDRAHGMYKKQEKEIDERNKKLHREAIEKENRERFNKNIEKYLEETEKAEQKRYELNKKLKEAQSKMDKLDDKLAEYEEDEFVKDSPAHDELRWEYEEAKEEYEKLRKEIRNQRRLEDGKEIHEVFRQMDDREMEAFAKKQPESIKKMQEYLQANRPNEYFQKQLKESGVKTFADEIKEQDKISNYYEEQERQALRSKDMSYGYSKKALENISNKELDDYINKQQELVNEYTNKVNQDLTYDQRKVRNRQDTVWDKGMKAKYEQQLKNAQEEKTRREEYVNKYFSKENNSQITNALRRKAYQKYLKEHPNSKMSFEDFKDIY